MQQLKELDAFSFERVVVELFRKLPDITHEVTRTQNVADGGFDFSGRFVLPEPLGYHIPFRGEVKRWKAGITPVEVSRLFARLLRGEYGIFVTTSWFSKQSQEEVYEHGYPVHLIDGGRLSGFFLQLGLVQGDRIDEAWLESTVSADR